MSFTRLFNYYESERVIKMDIRSAIEILDWVYSVVPEHERAQLASYEWGSATGAAPRTVVDPNVDGEALYVGLLDGSVVLDNLHRNELIAVAQRLGAADGDTRGKHVKSLREVVNGLMATPAEAPTEPVLEETSDPSPVAPAANGGFRPPKVAPPAGNTSKFTLPRRPLFKSPTT